MAAVSSPPRQAPWASSSAAQGLCQTAPGLVERSAGAIKKLLVLFERGASHFHFGLGPANYVTRPAYRKILPTFGPG